MAQQTINVGAAPNDGTGTPLRTAFQYTNSNFTELYTALGGGAGLPGATTQVIFNDGGTNLAGSTGLTYNKTTTRLTAGLLTVPGDTQLATVGTLYVGTILNPELKVDVVGGGVTVKGDLTVRTNKLAVTSTGVGIGTATPGLALDVVGSARVTYGQSYNSFTSGGSNSPMLSCQIWNAVGNIVVLQNPYSDVVIGSSTTGTSTERYRIASDGVATWSNVGGVAGTAMTLNSTGLGVGVSPSFKLHVQENTSNVIARFTGSNANGSVIDIINTGAGGGSYKIGSNFTIGGAGEFAIYDSTAAATRLLISSTGNVGIGVSTFGTSAAKVLGLANATAPSTSPAGMGQLYVESGALKYRGSSGTVTTIANA